MSEIFLIIFLVICKVRPKNVIFTFEINIFNQIFKTENKNIIDTNIGYDDYSTFYKYSKSFYVLYQKYIYIT